MTDDQRTSLHALLTDPDQVVWTQGVELARSLLGPLEFRQWMSETGSLRISAMIAAGAAKADEALASGNPIDFVTSAWRCISAAHAQYNALLAVPFADSGKGGNPSLKRLEDRLSPRLLILDD